MLMIMCKIVPDTMPLDTLLKFFLREHAHLAMAVDEFTRYLRADIDKWADIVRISGAKAGE